MEWIMSNWWLLLGFLVWYVLSKVIRKGEKNKTAGAESAMDQLAKEMAKAVPSNVISTIFSNALSKDKGASGLVDNPIARTALNYAAEAAITELESSADKPIVIKEGDHPLDAFAKRAVKSEETKAKTISGVKTAGIFILKIAKAVI